MPAWEVIQTRGDPHVMPVDDLREHFATDGCWCGPKDDDGVMVHNSMDRREFYERGEVRLS